MTLDEAILHAEEVADTKEKQVERGDWEKGSLTEKSCIACAEEHRQLAEWLRDYKRLLEQEQTTKNDLGVDCISRKFMHDLGATCIAYRNDKQMLTAIVSIDELPSVTPQEQKTGHWIPLGNYDDYGYESSYKCSECGDKDTYPNNFCPSCGAKMVEPQESEDKE